MGRAWLPVCFALLAVSGCQSFVSGPVTRTIVAYVAPATAQAEVPKLLSEDIGGSLDAEDGKIALAAEYRAMENGRAGQVVAWRGRSARGEILVGPLYRVNDTDCRQFTHVITIRDGQVETGRGRACRRPDGSWQPVA